MEKYNNINGDLITTGGVIIYGNVNGNVSCGGSCTVYGKVNGEVNAETTVNKDESKSNMPPSFDSILRKVADSVGNITSSIGNSLYMSGDGSQSVTHNGNKIKSENGGYIFINGKKLEGKSVSIKDNEVYIDGKKAEDIVLK